MNSAMEFTLRNADRATSALGVFTPKFFSRPTASSRASMESRPSPSGVNSEVSSPICSGVIFNIRLVTSICLMRAFNSGSDILCLRGKEREL